jgi:hypothetical protein
MCNLLVTFHTGGLHPKLVALAVLKVAAIAVPEPYIPSAAIESDARKSTKFAHLNNVSLNERAGKPESWARRWRKPKTRRGGKV